MNTWVITLSIIFSVPCIQVSQVEDSLTNNLLQFQLPEDTEEKPWYWGYIDETERNDSPVRLPVTTTTTTPMPVSDAGNPCQAVNYTTPDFSAPGRRVSLTKCYEYIWEMKVREEEDKRAEECERIEHSSSEGNVVPLVLNGRTPDPGEFLLMGAIGWKTVHGTWSFKCGSSVISPKFVLTAAHCSLYPGDEKLADAKPKIVRLGDMNIFYKDMFGAFHIDEVIINIIVHPQYAAPKPYYDIALMELKQPIKFNKLIQPGCLWSQSESSFGNKAQVTGWGVVKIGSNTMSPKLQVAELNIINSKTCDEQLLPRFNRNWYGVQDHQLCAVGTEGADACQGDSGGPLLVKIPLPSTAEGNMYYIIGVTSFGYGCGLPNLPGVYTRVSSFLDWIESIVWPEI